MAIAHLTSIELDHLADGSATQSAASHVVACAQCRADLEALEAARAHFDREVLTRTLPTVKARLTRRRWVSQWPLFLTIPAAAVFLILVAPRLARHASGELGVKGGATIQTFARRGVKIFEVRDGMTLQKGDQLRFEIQPGGLPYLLMGAIDAKGNASLVYPLEGQESGPIDPLARFIPPGSAELDDACGPERAFVLLSRRPIEAPVFLRALSDLGARGSDAIRAARTLSGTEADDQLTIGWEKCAR